MMVPAAAAAMEDRISAEVKNISLSMEKAIVEKEDLTLQINASPNINIDGDWRKNEVAITSHEFWKAYIKIKKWISLRESLEAVLDQSDQASLAGEEHRAAPALRDTGMLYYLSQVKALLQQGGGGGGGGGADSRESGGYTMLHGAASWGHLPVAELLLRRGDPVDARDKLGATPLMWAAMNGHLEVAERLVRAGASLTATCDERLTAADWARRHCHAAVEQYLCQLQRQS
ncbi:ankyrin repeat domain-containing protein 65-like [Bacillus rossius redtenbacheri]|uniref:ankyrin repeat domain-containing protein 65-like n=1 Tax=Bacillus rossius redtenbacheri TaxID=93214 RepID=UPI002FDE6C2E